MKATRPKRMQAAATQIIKIVYFMLYLLGRDIGQRDLHGKCGSLALFAGYLDDPMMHGYRTSCNSKSKTGSADLSGMGFIHTIKTLKDPFNGIFRYSQAGYSPLTVTSAP